jgi:hypothetical protein
MRFSQFFLNFMLSSLLKKNLFKWISIKNYCIYTGSIFILTAACGSRDSWVLICPRATCALRVWPAPRLTTQAPHVCWRVPNQRQEHKRPVCTRCAQHLGRAQAPRGHRGVSTPRQESSATCPLVIFLR